MWFFSNFWQGYRRWHLFAIFISWCSINNIISSCKDIKITSSVRKQILISFILWQIQPIERTVCLSRRQNVTNGGIKSATEENIAAVRGKCCQWLKYYCFAPSCSTGLHLPIHYVENFVERSLWHKVLVGQWPCEPLSVTRFGFEQAPERKKAHF